MNSIDSPHNHISRTDWQKLGELKLRAGSNPDGTIKAWLTHILSDFSIHNDLVNKLLKSMEDAAMRVLMPNGAAVHLENLEIVVLAPADQASQGQAWGFFRVERISTDSEADDSLGHSIDYYLYLDRNSGKYQQTP